MNENNDKWDLQALSNQELARLYEQYDVGSVDFAAVRAEMVRRGFRFQDPAPEEENDRDNELSRGHTGRNRAMLYSKGWSQFWAILFVVLGLVLFIAMMDKAEWEPGTQTGLLFGLAAVMVFSLGALVSGARNLANHKTRNPEAARSGAWQIILGLIWSLAGAGVIYYGIRMVGQALEWDEEAALGIGAIAVAAALVCAAFAVTLITLGKEMKSTD